MSFERYERACQQGNSFRAIQLAGDEFRYHWVAAKYGLQEVITHFEKRCGHYMDWTLLAHIGARWGQLKFVRWLVKQHIGAGAWMSLNFAAAQGNLAHVRYYVERWGIEPDSTQVIWAGDSGHPEIVKYIYTRLTKRFDHDRAENYYKMSLEFPTEQWYRDREKREETILWLRDYYTDRFVL